MRSTASRCLLCAAFCAAVKFTFTEDDADDIIWPNVVSGDDLDKLRSDIDECQDQQQLESVLVRLAAQLGVPADEFVSVVTTYAARMSAATAPQPSRFAQNVLNGYTFDAAWELFVSSKAGEYSASLQMFLAHMAAPAEDAAGMLVSGLRAYMLAEQQRAYIASPACPHSITSVDGVLWDTMLPLHCNMYAASITVPCCAGAPF
jgi:hypothetical protein